MPISQSSRVGLAGLLALVVSGCLLLAVGAPLIAAAPGPILAAGVIAAGTSAATPALLVALVLPKPENRLKPLAPR